jgi:rod shape determining protein RodA
VRSQEAKINNDFDIWTALIYFLLVGLGWLNIYAAGYDPSANLGWLDPSLTSTKQLFRIGVSVVLIIIILTVDYRVFDTYAFLIYLATIFMLLLVLIFGKEVNGDRNWLDIGGLRLQPSEFAKFGTALALARFMTFQYNNQKNPLLSYASRVAGVPTFLWDWLNMRLAYAGAIIFVPILIILLQGDAGSALVFMTFSLVLYREGLIPNWVLGAVISIITLFVVSLFVREEDLLTYVIIPILTVTLLLIISSRKRTYQSVTLNLLAAGLLIVYVISVEFIFNNVLEAHQKNRILVLIDDEVDPEGRKERYNLKHSLVAIGSGGLVGKGFLQGTQTKLNYVPEQSTDFIFCTVGEEYGWLGSFVTVFLFLALMYRLVDLAERQKDKFARVFGYSVASIIFFHFAINIAMTIGLFPVVGIPLPFVSYGGSSLWGFTILVFIFLKLDAHRESQMERK